MNHCVLLVRRHLKRVWFTKFWGEVKNGPSLEIYKNKKDFSFRECPLTPDQGLCPWTGALPLDPAGSSAPRPLSVPPASNLTLHYWMIAVLFGLHKEYAGSPWRLKTVATLIERGWVILLSFIVTMTSKSMGKTGILTPCRSETPENFILLVKLDTLIALHGATRMPNFMGIGLGVSATQIAEI